LRKFYPLILFRFWEIGTRLSLIDFSRVIPPIIGVPRSIIWEKQAQEVHEVSW
jgi:hypothetical protein